MNSPLGPGEDIIALRGHYLMQFTVLCIGQSSCSGGLVIKCKTETVLH